jgi:hypothetical protein
MTFELLKVCRQANPAWIELRVMYVRSTVSDRHARWVIILIKIIVFKKSNYLLFFYFFISFCLLFFFLPFSSYQSISFCFRWFRFISFPFRWFRFVSFRFVFVDFVSFRFYFVSHFIGTPMLDHSHMIYLSDICTCTCRAV